MSVNKNLDMYVDCYINVIGKTRRNVRNILQNNHEFTTSFGDVLKNPIDIINKLCRTHFYTEPILSRIYINMVLVLKYYKCTHLLKPSMELFYRRIAQERYFDNNYLDALL